MSIARRIGVALAIAGSVVPLAAASSQRASPGYTYRLRTTGRVTEPNGRTTDYVIMSGRALVSEKGGRLDVDEASPKRGAMAVKDSYILYDSTSMTVVSPKNRQIVRLSLDTLERELWAASVPGTRVTISDVAVNLEKLGAGEPMLGRATTRYRITQDFKVAATMAPVSRSSTEHIVQDFWMADEQKGLANPFARLGVFRAGPASGFGELLTRTAEARSSMGRGVPLKTVTTNTSTSNRNGVTQTVTTMEVTDLQAENVDDDILVAPTDYQAVVVSELARTAQNSQGAQPGEPAKVARPAATDNAAAEAKQGLVKTLHGMGRRP
jgi:hypothetical protein